MGIRIFHTTATGRAKCRRAGCERFIAKGELCVFAQSTNVPQIARCAGYVCWGCFTVGLTKGTVARQNRLEKKNDAQAKTIIEMSKGIKLSKT